MEMGFNKEGGLFIAAMTGSRAIANSASSKLHIMRMYVFIDIRTN